jgi:hypothetical protein
MNTNAVYFLTKATQLGLRQKYLDYLVPINNAGLHHGYTDFLSALLTVYESEESLFIKLGGEDWIDLMPRLILLDKEALLEGQERYLNK